MTAGGKWADLGPRLASGLAMVVIGAGAIWVGGAWFTALAVVASGLMVWELAAMMRPGSPAAVPLGLAAALAVLVALILPDRAALVLLALPALAGALVLKRDPAIFALYGLGIMLAAWGLVVFRGE